MDEVKMLAAETSGNLIGSVHLADCLELCERVYRAGVRVDMILADLPYGQTDSSWDEIIPFDPMWDVFKKILRPKGAIVLTATQPFTSKLVCSNLKMFRYEWVWNKCSPVGHLNAHIRPMSLHESVLVFSNGGETYNPQLRTDVSAPFGKIKPSASGVYGYSGVDRKSGVGYPTSILKYAKPNNLTGGNLHPNQKPVDLIRYLIRTYTLPDEIVFDPTCGSGTTAIAAREEGRRFIVGDSSSEYVQVARNRLAQPYTPSFMPQLETA